MTALSATLFAISSVFACAFYIRWAMPYNEEGRFFDLESLIVYKQQSVLVYGLLAITALVLATFTLRIAIRVGEKNL